MLNEKQKEAIDLLEKANLLLEVLHQSLETGSDNHARYHLVEIIREKTEMASKALSPL
ncbi:MAG: hypothetical protein KDK27_04625 [Leptospiraceae bacterium]|nr:hypothetical protein [Leptospiraceae bacterium]